MRRAPAIGLAVIAALAGCSTQGAEHASVTVFAAASLTESFERIAGEFEQAHPGIDVVLNLGGSSGLAAQIVAGAPADVFASASPETMQLVVDEGMASAPQTFATNTLGLVVPPGNPGAVAGLADLADPDLIVVLCAPEVPCGAAAAHVLDAAGVSASVDSFEQDVRAVLTKVVLGEADAGLVYATDVRAAGDAVASVPVDVAQEAVAYSLATLNGSPAATAFSEWVLSARGQAVLREAGFGAP